MMGRGGMMDDPYALPYGRGSQAAQAEKKSGFVVTIVGYSPYEDIGELLEPIGAEGAPSRWGFITRLAHLDEIVDGNSPFELYEKADPNHFKLDTGPVGLDEKTPRGIGFEEVRYEKADPMMRSMGTGKRFLIDPMTKEDIGKVAVLDEFGQERLDRDNNPVYVTNDQWFILNVKFVWKDGPAPPETPGMGTYPGSPYGMRGRPGMHGRAAPGSSSTPSSGVGSSGGRRAPGLPGEF
jgi:hypothetical protein